MEKTLDVGEVMLKNVGKAAVEGTRQSGCHIKGECSLIVLLRRVILLCYDLCCARRYYLRAQPYAYDCICTLRVHMHACVLWCVRVYGTSLLFENKL